MTTVSFWRLYTAGRRCADGLQVGAGTVGSGALAGTARQLGPHLLELLARRHLLGEERRLDAVEEPLEPSDELGLGHPQLGLRRRLVLREGDGQPLQLV